MAGPFPSAPYYKGRFSNGRAWIELVAATFGAELENFATGNAISGASGEASGQFMVQPPYANLSSASEVLVPSTLDQVGSTDLFVPFTQNTASEGHLQHKSNLLHTIRSCAILCLLLNSLLEAMALCMHVLMFLLAVIVGSMRACILLHQSSYMSLCICNLQAATYLYNHHGVANPSNTYIIFIGANDYLNTVNMTANATVAGVVQAINQTMTNLYNGGARE